MSEPQWQGLIGRCLFLAAVALSSLFFLLAARGVWALIEEATCRCPVC